MLTHALQSGAAQICNFNMYSNYKTFYFFLSLILATRLFFVYINNFKINYIDGYVITYPNVKSHYQIISLNNYKVILPSSVKVDIGDRVYIEKGPARNNYIYYPRFNIKETFMSQLMKYPADIRCSYLKSVKSYYVSNHAALISSLTLGEVADISYENYLEIRDSGLLHIFAVSGYNFSLVTMPIILFMRKNKSAILSLVALFISILYLLLVGLEPSVLRAFFMLTVFIIYRLANRNGNIFIYYLVSLFLSVIVFPFYLYKIGFYLSYIATLAVILGIKLKCKNIVHKAIFINFIVFLFTFPLILYFFNKINVLSFLGSYIITLTLPVIYFLILFDYIFRINISEGVLYYFLDFIYLIAKLSPRVFLDTSEYHVLSFVIVWTVVVLGTTVAKWVMHLLYCHLRSKEVKGLRGG